MTANSDSRSSPSRRPEPTHDSRASRASPQARKAVQVITADGHQLSAGRAILFALEEIDWHPSMVRLGGRRPFVWVVELGYWIVAHNRSFFGRFLFRPKESIWSQLCRSAAATLAFDHAGVENEAASRVSRLWSRSLKHDHRGPKRPIARRGNSTEFTNSAHSLHASLSDVIREDGLFG
jgi:hypothetical protein